MSASQSIFICEGYHDRSFLSGWLKELGCTDPSQTGSRVVKDPWGRPVVGGQFGFLDPLDRFVRIVPARGESQCFRLAASLLEGRHTQAIRDLFVVVDGDLDSERRRDSFSTLVGNFGGDRLTPSEAKLQDSTRLHLLVFEHENPMVKGVPVLQSLERIICSAISLAYPERAELVAEWLSRIGGSTEPTSVAKAHGWSYMAGWYAKLGCDAFHSHLWEDECIKKHFKEILESGGTWQSVHKAICER